jgi:hypothetical protein
LHFADLFKLCFALIKKVKKICFAPQSAACM